MRSGLGFYLAFATQAQPESVTNCHVPHAPGELSPKIHDSKRIKFTLCRPLIAPIREAFTSGRMNARAPHIILKISDARKVLLLLFRERLYLARLLQVARVCGSGRGIQSADSAQAWAIKP